MQLKIDLHIHTNQSRDSTITISEAIVAAKQKGLNGIAITDHDIATKITQYKESHFILIPGIEISTADGHFLAIGVDQHIPEKLSATQTAEKIREAGGLAIVPHPYSIFAKKISQKIIERERFDGLEVLNASYPLFKYSSKKGIELAEKLGLPQIGGSDSHIVETIGDAYTVIQADDPTVEGVLEAIRKNQTTACGKATSLFHQLKKFYSIAKHRLR